MRCMRNSAADLSQRHSPRTSRRRLLLAARRGLSMLPDHLDPVNEGRTPPTPSLPPRARAKHRSAVTHKLWTIMCTNQPCGTLS